MVLASGVVCGGGWLCDLGVALRLSPHCRGSVRSVLYAALCISRCCPECRAYVWWARQMVLSNMWVAIPCMSVCWRIILTRGHNRTSGWSPAGLQLTESLGNGSLSPGIVFLHDVRVGIGCLP